MVTANDRRAKAGVPGGRGYPWSSPPNKHQEHRGNSVKTTPGRNSVHSGQSARRFFPAEGRPDIPAPLFLSPRKRDHAR